MNDQQCTFLSVYRNTFLRTHIFSYLLASRKGYYVYYDSKLSFNYHQLNTMDLLKLNNNHLLKEKLNRFKSVINNSNISNSNSFTCYQDWLDNKKHEALNLALLQYGSDMDDDLLDTIMELFFKLESKKSSFILTVFKKFGITRSRFQRFAKYLPKRIDYTKIKDKEFFIELVNDDRIRIDYYPVLKNDQFFMENKDIFRKIKDWSDEKFLCDLLVLGLENQQKISLLCWILTVSPLYNYDRYMEMSAISTTTTPRVDYVYLYGIKIIHNKDHPFYHGSNSYMTSYQAAFCSQEIMEYTIKHYPDAFANSFSEDNFKRIIKDPVKSKLLIEYNNNANYPYSFDPTSDDLEIVELCYKYGQIVRECNLVNTLEKLQCFAERLPNLFHDVFYQCLIYACSTNNSEYMKYCLDNFPDDFNVDNMLEDLFKVGGNNDAFKCFYHWVMVNINTKYLNDVGLEIQSKEDSFHFICCLYSSKEHQTFDTFKSYYEKIKRPHLFVDQLLTKAYMNLYTCQKHDKQESIKILEYVKNQYQIHNSPPADIDYFSVFYQDRKYAQLINYKNPHNIYSAIKYAFVWGSVAKMEKILDLMDQEQYSDFVQQVQDIVLSHFYFNPSSQVYFLQYKVALYCFERFADQFSQSTLDSLCHIALITDNHKLMDILLHKTKVRLIRPQSPEHDKQMLELNYMNLTKSENSSRTNYFTLHPFTLDIDDQTLNNHIVPPFVEPNFK
ncbi:hypothetical protein CYY_005217 [Polysphondylium violaceum]|uniref:Uncharacterized protein n=1 Tax=Polysphondylium violaceum TaxID=133409 RepID=A0A8J4V719_9MYCE|nr:hypothetical protein CYY_005217 [Polysphondylium violaceum]